MQEILPVQSRRALQRQSGAIEQEGCRASSTPHTGQRSRLAASGLTLLKRAGLPLALLVLLAGWHALVVLGGYRPFVLPGPLLVGARLLEAAGSGLLWDHIRATMLVAMSGFGLALVVSSVLGYILAHTRWLDRTFSPVLAASQAIPIIAIAPLLVLWFGTGMLSKILVAALITFFPVLLSTIAAFRSVPRELREMALLNGANRWQMLRYVELPLSLPVFFVGVRTGLALATTGAVVAEFVAGRSGLGALITIARGLFDTPLIFVVLIILAGITLGLYVLASLLERALVKWEV